MRDELRRLHQDAGAPGKSALKSHADAAGHHVAESTLIGLISPTAKGRPRPATVEAFVDACASYAARRGHPLPAEDRDKLRWIARLETAAPAPDRAFADARAAYLSRLRERFGRIDTETLLPLADQETPVPVRLREVFVPQHVRADPPRLDLPRGVLRRLIDAGDVDPDELPAGFDHERLARARAAYRERPPRPVLEVLAGPEGRRSVVVGDPGAGKSTLARYLALAAADTDDVLPILVELRAYAADTTETFLNMIDRRNMQDGLGLPRPLLEKYLLSGGRALVVFDGLDEVFDPGLRREISDRITGFAARYPQVRVLVTSRVIGYLRGPFDAAGFHHFMLQDLDDNQVDEFAGRWYELACPHDLAEAARLARRLRDGIGAARAVRELAGNPLLLTILAIIARRAELPRDRRTAYEHAVTVLVEHWEVNKSPAAADSPLGRDEKLEMLRLIARHMQADVAGNHITRSVLLEHLRAYLTDVLGLPVVEARRTARIMLEQFQSRNFILSHFGGDVFGFVHRAFLEYMAAADIVQRFHDRELSEDDLLGIYAAHWQDPSWHEVLLLIVGMQESFAGRIIDFLLAEDPDWFRRRNGIPHHLLLAIRSLGEVRRVGKLVAQCEAVADVIGRMMETASRRRPLEQAVERAALPMLAGHGTTWPGRHRYHEWYQTRGRFLGDVRPVGYAPSVVPTAARLGVVMLADDAGFRRLLLNQVRTAQQASARVAAGEALAFLADDLDIRTTLRDVATSDLSQQVRQRVAVSLVKFDPTDQATLAMAHDLATSDPTRAVRHSVMRELTVHARHASATHDLLVDRAATDPHREIRRLALRVLARDWHDDPALHAFLEDRAVNDQNSQVRATALRVLAKHWPEHGGMRPLIDALVDSPDAPTRRIGLSALADSEPASPTILSRIRGFARADPDPGVRQVALRLVMSRWPDDVETLPLLLDQLNDPSVASVAMQIITHGWPDDPRALAALKSRAGPDAGESVWAPEIEQVAEYRTDIARSRALRRLATARPDDPDVLNLLRRTLAEGSRATKRVAIFELAASRHAQPGIFDGLRRCGETDPDSLVRIAAVRAVADRLPDDPEIARWLRTVAENDDSGGVRAAALAALAPTWLADDDVAGLFRRAASAELDIRARRVAVTIVADVWPDEPTTLPMLHGLIRSDRGWLRRLALETLAVGWRDHPSTLPLLRRLAGSDPTGSVRRAASEALNAYPASARGDVVDAAQNRPGDESAGVE
ncbi:HEAT repeat domain-containing protein [Actinoplanes sp. NPDC051513]|uniref:HEAT repeat domain-containing protein n=1 Tax=Actinoplanes sp. NPDC051513 TaxID=3363908 RepID=UPI0037A5570E